MNDAPLMRVLDRLADLYKELKPIICGERMLIAVFGDLDPTNQLHDEIWAPRFGRPGIKHLRDIGVVHQRQCLPLGLKPGDHALRIHSRLDDFQSDPPADRCLLFGHVNHSASAFTNLLQQLVMANAVTRFFSRLKRLSCSCWPVCSRSAKKIACLVVSLQQSFYSETELGVSLA